MPELQALEPVCREQDNCTDVGSCRSPRTNSSTCLPRTTRLCGRSRRFCGCSRPWCAAPWSSGASIPAPLPRLLLAGHWLWAGLVYHALFFTAINPAAWLFAALFVAQGVLFIAFRSSARQAVDRAGSTRRVVSSLLIVYSLIYPVVVWADGFVYPRMPTFGVPCPTVAAHDRSSSRRVHDLRFFCRSFPWRGR